eukprot:CAMPEP_0183317590 /NCGR_PEP_ID=MMETSP0160_2-20130417/58360_1 /TAXON_ID=2839 ORGANISM="Odontella Sinensis, Strain Grunow 1884" /NCGR_SAMPLE_ID=MMETSP0160_2 /ASSEMBLY_ACC=CAM_ASM_000250 /LENGTH=464 /DNA_ID=CAMNT_0025483645 /DNA_START=107 /DNA_END=1501 /DNA_ORIENTATION=+
MTQNSLDRGSEAHAATQASASALTGETSIVEVFDMSSCASAPVARATAVATEKCKTITEESINISVPAVKRFNLLVVGTSGSGKTTFCTRLLRPYFPGLVLKSPQGPTKKIEERGRCEKVQGDTRIIVTVVDTPGWGDSLDNNDRFEPIEKYIEEQNDEYERNELYRKPNHQEEDTRIHCCFYFLSPHRVSPLDCQFMKRLQPRVAIVPIISKADTMVVSELATHLQNIRNCLDKHFIEVFDFKEKNIDEHWLEGPSHDRDTFIQVGSNLGGSATNSRAQMHGYSEEQENVLTIPYLELSALPRIRNVFAVISGIRRYMWYTVTEEDERHSDTQRLHGILFQAGSLGMLRQHADEIHEGWRLKRERARREEIEQKRVEEERARQEELDKEKAKEEQSREKHRAPRSSTKSNIQAFAMVQVVWFLFLFCIFASIVSPGARGFLVWLLSVLGDSGLKAVEVLDRMS